MMQPKPATSAPRAPGQAGGGRRRAPGRQHVVDDQHPLAGLQGVLVDLQGVDPVLEAVGLGVHLPGQLAGLADRDETGPQAHGDRGGDDEARGPRRRSPCPPGARRRRRPGPSTHQPGPPPLASSGVMSLKTTPGCGKSGISRIRSFSQPGVPSISPRYRFGASARQVARPGSDRPLSAAALAGAGRGRCPARATLSGRPAPGRRRRRSRRCAGARVERRRAFVRCRQLGGLVAAAGCRVSRIRRRRPVARRVVGVRALARPGGRRVPVVGLPRRGARPAARSAFRRSHRRRGAGRPATGGRRAVRPPRPRQRRSGRRWRRPRG